MKLFYKNRQRKRYYKRLIDKIEESIYSMELRILTIKNIREGIRREYDNISGVIKGLDERLKDPKGAKGKQIEDWRKQKDSLKIDADKMKEQMVGKWSEGDQQYIEGIDQEIKAVQGKIEGGREFQWLIKKELKKL